MKGIKKPKISYTIKNTFLVFLISFLFAMLYQGIDIGMKHLLQFFL